MKIVIVISKFPPEYSGPGVRMPKLYTFLREAQPIESVKVVCNGIEQTENLDYEYDGLPVTRRSASGFVLVKSLLAFLRPHLARIIESFQTLFWLYKNAQDADMLHILGNSGGTAAGLLWARMHDIPVMMELVTAKARPSQRFSFVNIEPDSNRSVLVCLTQKTRDACLKGGYPAQAVWYRPNPVDEAQYKPATHEEKQALRAALTPFAMDDIVIATVAKIIPQKNQILLIRALANLPERFKLVIAGPFVSDGPLYERDKAYLESMRSLIREHGLESRVHLHIGFVSSADYMRASDVYALPAWDEGFGTPMIEAMACGLPVIANTDESAFREWIVDARNGFLCAIDKPEDWAQAIEKASLFTIDQREAEAVRIKSVAGQTGVYQAYADLVQHLASKTAADGR